MKKVKLKRFKIKVYGKPAKVPMKGMTAPEEHTHFLHSLLTNNVKSLKPYTFNYNLWLKQNGQPVGDFFVYKLSDYYILDTEKPAQEVIEEFNRLKLSLKVYFEDLSEQLAHLFLFGEGVGELVEKTFGRKPQDFQIVEAEGILIASNPLRLRTEGYDVIGSPEKLSDLFKEAKEISEQEFEDFRIENCVPRIGKELREGFSPLEAGMVGTAIDMNKGCYVGQEAIARVYYKGKTPRTLVKILGEGLKEGSDLLADSKKVGLVTSVNSSGTVALGYILRDYLEKKLTPSEGKVSEIKECVL